MAPSISSATFDVTVIGTPNHKMIPVNLTVVADDASGNASYAEVTVTVPKSQGKKK